MQDVQLYNFVSRARRLHLQGFRIPARASRAVLDEPRSLDALARVAADLIERSPTKEALTRIAFPEYGRYCASDHLGGSTNRVG